MRNTNIKRYKRLSDQQRVEVYGTRHAKIALVSLIAFTIMVVVGALAIPGRMCPVAAEGEPQSFLSWGSCITCPKNCISCSSSEKCNSCTEGHYLSLDSNQCLDCDSDSSHNLCRQCEAPPLNSG